VNQAVEPDNATGPRLRLSSRAGTYVLPNLLVLSPCAPDYCLLYQRNPTPYPTARRVSITRSPRRLEELDPRYPRQSPGGGADSWACTGPYVGFGCEVTVLGERAGSLQLDKLAMDGSLQLCSEYCSAGPVKLERDECNLREDKWICKVEKTKLAVINLSMFSHTPGPIKLTS
jgi:hypothetical protein